MGEERRELVPNRQLVNARLEQHWSQRELAARLGTTFVNVSRWERGITFPGVYYRRLLCQLFGKSAAELGLVLAPVPGKTPQTLPVPCEEPPDEVAPLAPFWYLPYPRNPFFTGRGDLLLRLHDLLKSSSGQSVTLCGMGGIGKTQAALEYAYRYADEYQAILWLHAETAESLAASYLTLADLLKLPACQEREQARIVAAVQAWLAARRDWLLIVDNVEDLELVKRALPPILHGSLLLTARQQALDLSAHVVYLETLSRDEGLAFLRRRARVGEPGASGLAVVAEGTDDEALQEIALTMDGLPLALDQAGSYLEATRCHPADYLHLLRSALLPLLDEREAHAGHPLSVVRTFTLAWEQLKREQPEASELFTTCAYLAPTAIPEILFLQGAAELGPTFERFVTHPLSFQHAMRALLAYALVQRDPASRSVTIHRLVQMIQRESQPEDLQRLWRSRVLGALGQLFPASDMLGPARWGLCETLLPHALASVALWEQDAEESGVERHLRWLSAVGDYLTRRARYAEAGALFRRLLDHARPALGADHPLLAFPLHGLAVVALEQGNYGEAEPLFQGAICLREAGDHLLLATSLVNLALLFWLRGAYDEAEPLYLRVIQIEERLLGSEHPELALPLTGLAALSWQQGRHELAEQLYLRALRIMDPASPATAHTLHGLADLYRQQGKYALAQPLLQQALHMQERHLGAEHPHVARLLTNLAMLSSDQGNYAEAEQLYRQALRLQEAALGAGHPDIGYALHGLADLYRQQGNPGEAEKLYQRVAHLLAETLGPEHPRVAYPLYRLALLYQDQGQPVEARRLFTRILEIRRQALGGAHPETVEVIEALARLPEVVELSHLVNARPSKQGLRSVC